MNTTLLLSVSSREFRHHNQFFHVVTAVSCSNYNFCLRRKVSCHIKARGKSHMSESFLRGFEISLVIFFSLYLTVFLLPGSYHCLTVLLLVPSSSNNEFAQDSKISLICSPCENGFPFGLVLIVD
jgi:hypothetical protein